MWASRKRWKSRLLTANEHRVYRRRAGQLWWLSAQRRDISFAVQVLSRNLQAPDESDERALKCVLRYQRGTTGLEAHIEPTLYARGEPLRLEAYSEADWAGCTATRKSTSGGCVLLQGVVIHGWSKTQAIVSLSSAEAEYVGAYGRSS